MKTTCNRSEFLKIINVREATDVPGMDKELLKEATKEAIHEWLDEKFILFGKWSMSAIAASGLAALTYFILKMNGWNK